MTFKKSNSELISAGYDGRFNNSVKSKKHQWGEPQLLMDLEALLLSELIKRSKKLYPA